ncbi:PP2C family protein-serine/threonine phosphatase [Actinomadura hibisca]|uniref:PP2C family protein-serine/threonine phosphatase n=1 Tax=Actinomadura hibisca TaxID=68565 RepID=UPI000829F215|nr:PP2C family protein-serine/threonine phosphatase [Actinomadura hibisca]
MTEVDGPPAELAELRDAARERALLAEARAVLAGRLGCPSGEALQHLIWLARDLDVELPEAAALVARGEGVEAPAVPAARALAAAPPAEPPRQSEQEEVLRRVAAVDSLDDEALLIALPDDVEARAALDASLGSAAHLVPVRGPGGRVVDFLYAALNERARDLFDRGPNELAGGRLLRTDPGAALSGLFDAYVGVLETGVPFTRGPFEHSTAQDGFSRSSRMSLRCVPVPTGVVVTWHFHREEDRVQRRLERVERLAKIAFGEWDLVTGEVAWSADLMANYGLSPETVPATPHDLAKVVAEDDVAVVEEAVQTLMARLEPVEIEHRVATSDGRHRHLWLVAEPVLDANGRPVAVHIVSQDISRRRGIERALADTRRAMLRQQIRAAQEHRVAVTLRRAVLPDSGEVEPLPGLDVAVRSLAAGSADRIGGDWFATRALPDGRALFAIGDAAGHGLTAAAAMARTRGGLLGLAYTGRPPGRLMAWLNELVGDLDHAATGTAVVARFDPATRLLEWTNAGHPPPILVRDGAAIALETPPDTMLGALPEMEYATHTRELLPGDLLFLYTDGLIERRDVGLDTQIDRLAGVLAVAADEPEFLLARALERMEHDGESDDTTLFALRVA